MTVGSRYSPIYRTMKCPIAVLFFFLTSSFANENEYQIDYSTVTYITRNVTQGELVGMSMPLVTDNSQHFEAFVGIPYAQPPVGDLRWRRPVKVNPWAGQYNATYYRPACPQPLQYIQEWSLGPDYNNSNEDCLYLNIFRVKDNSSTDNDLQPVMMWIHRGGFTYGSGEEYDSRVIAQNGAVIVTINFRLGVLGFLSTEDDEALGNFGLLDMVEALHWIRENIASFGGDPERVTVFGGSGGAAGVSLLIFSKLTENVMHRAIMQSGSALWDFAIYRPPDTILPRTKELAERFACPTEPSQSLLDCLRQKDATDLVLTEIEGTAVNSAWAPRVDGYFIDKLPEELLASGDFNPVDVLTGSARDEVSDEYVDVPGIEIGFNRSEKERQMKEWSAIYKDKADLAYNAVLHEYNGPGDDPGKNRDLMLELRSDSEGVAPVTALASGHALFHNNVRLYSWQYRSPNATTPEWMGILNWSDLRYIFGVPFLPDNASCPWGCLNKVWRQFQEEWGEEDERMSRAMMTAWTNFATTGDPANPKTTPGLTTSWSQFNSSTEHYMLITGTADQGYFREEQFYKFNRVDFWNVYLPGLMDASMKCPTVTSPSPPTTPATSPPSILHAQRCHVLTTLHVVTAVFVSLLCRQIL